MSNFRWHSGHKRPRRGNIIILTTFLLVVVFAMVAFSVDIGYICHADTELQRTADACAIAAVQRLPDQSTSTFTAQNVAIKNRGTVGPDLEPTDVVFGYWDRDMASFTRGGSPVNAVHVTVERTAARGNSMELFFAGVVGTSDADIKTTSVAMYDNNLCGPLVGIDWVYVDGEPSTDSFRSGDGSYFSQKPRDNGNLCSDGPIFVDGTSAIHGDANPGRNSQTTITGDSYVTGNMSPRLRPLNLPDVDTTEIAAQNDNLLLPQIQKGNSWVDMLDANRNFILDGGRSYTMPAGDYYLNDLILTGQSILTVEPSVNIYMTGSLDTSGGDIINSSKIANNLRIFMTGGTARIAGSSDNYMVVYAPRTPIVITGDAGYFGAAVGKTLAVSGNTQVHYDEDLKLDDALNMPKRIAIVQ